MSHHIRVPHITTPMPFDVVSPSAMINKGIDEDGYPILVEHFSVMVAFTDGSRFAINTRPSLAHTVDKDIADLEAALADITTLDASWTECDPIYGSQRHFHIGDTSL